MMRLAHGFDPVLSALAIDRLRLYAERKLARDIRETSENIGVILYYHAQAIAFTKKIKQIEAIETKMRAARRAAKRAAYL